MTTVRKHIDLRGTSERTGMSIAYWRKQIQLGRIAAKKTGGKLLLALDDIEAWADSLPEREPGQAPPHIRRANAA